MYTSDGIDVSLPFKLDFPCSNNEAKRYRADFCPKDGSPLALCTSYSRLIIKQVNEEFKLKEITLMSYGIATQKLIKSFQVFLRACVVSVE